jgi:energy-converting hydrogenase Eha subunit E
MRALGAFVSTGAFGLALGIVFFSWPLLYTVLLTICVLSTAYMHMDLKAGITAINSQEVECRFGKLFIWMSLLVLMLVVMLRSFVGETFSGEMSRTNSMVLLIGLLLMLGKMAGGWLAHHLGIIRMLALVIVLVLVCLVFRSQEMVIALVGLFAVNCTMPVTLYLANVVLPKREGLAFGLLAAALIPGYIIAFI